MAEESAVAASSSSPANSGAFFKTSGSTRYLPDHGTALDGKATVECSRNVRALEVGSAWRRTLL